MDAAACVLAAQAEAKRQAKLQAMAALLGIELHRLDDGRWLACRWGLNRALEDGDVESWLQRAGAWT